MKTTILLAMLNAIPHQDDEFCRWYDEEHLPDILKIPGVLGGRRFRVCDDAAPNDLTPWKYLTIYTVEEGRDDAIRAEIRRRIESGEIKMSPTVAPSPRSWFFEEI